jgi:hypothetical protein
LTNNKIQNNRSNIHDKHTKIDNVIEDNESSAYDKYSKDIKNKVKVLWKMPILCCQILYFKFIFLKNLHNI